MIGLSESSDKHLHCVFISNVRTFRAESAEKWLAHPFSGVEDLSASFPLMISFCRSSNCETDGPQDCLNHFQSQFMNVTHPSVEFSSNLVGDFDSDER